MNTITASSVSAILRNLLPRHLRLLSEVTIYSAADLPLSEKDCRRMDEVAYSDLGRAGLLSVFARDGRTWDWDANILSPSPLAEALFGLRHPDADGAACYVEPSEALDCTHIPRRQLPLFVEQEQSAGGPLNFGAEVSR